MKKFRVQASYVSYCYAVVEAENEDEAYEKARELDGSDFEPDYSSAGAGDWAIYDVNEVEA